jgi:hypothetical protein
MGENRPTIGDNDLDELRGGQNVVIGQPDHAGAQRGQQHIRRLQRRRGQRSDNALSNFNGLGNIMINTGSQVNLQSGMNITINVHP